MARAFSLLEAFDDDRRSLSLGELSRRAGLPLSTALRLASHLVTSGALERDADDRYVIGLRLFEIASLAPRTHGLRQIAMPYLEDLHEVSRQHVLLAVPDNDQALLVERLSTHGAVEIAYRVGGRMPLDDTGVGIALLAGSDPDARDRYLGQLDPTAAAHLRRRLADVAHLKVAVFERRQPAPVSSVAAAIRDRANTTVAAVSIVVPAGSARPTAYIHVVRATALAISRGLGHVPEVRTHPSNAP